MPTSLLQILNDCLLALLLLFLVRVLRAVWAQTKPAPAAAVAVAPARPSKAPATRTTPLRVIDPAGGPSFDIGDEVTVGRAAGCGVSLSDTTVSQLHARLFRRDGRLYIEDLGSTNGTWVNRNRIGAPVALRKGDQILVGHTTLEVGK